MPVCGNPVARSIQEFEVSTMPESLITPTETRVRDSQDQCGHVVQFYSEDGFLVDELSKLIGAALGSGQAAVVITTNPHTDALAEHLPDPGVAIARAEQSV